MHNLRPMFFHYSTLYIIHNTSDFLLYIIYDISDFLLYIKYYISDFLLVPAKNKMYEGTVWRVSDMVYSINISTISTISKWLNFEGAIHFITVFKKMYCMGVKSIASGLTLLKPVKSQKCYISYIVGNNIFTP